MLSVILSVCLLLISVNVYPGIVDTAAEQLPEMLEEEENFSADGQESVSENSGSGSWEDNRNIEDLSDSDQGNEIAEEDFGDDIFEEVDDTGEITESAAEDSSDTLFLMMEDGTTVMVQDPEGVLP